MKSTIVALLMAFIAVSAFAAQPFTKTSLKSYNGTLANETGLAYSNTYVVDMSSYDAAKASAQVDYGSATFSAATFTDGTQSTGSVTVLSTTALSGVTLTINRVTLTAGTDYVVDVPTQTAANIATAINANSFLAPIILAEASGSVVTSTSVAVGGNYPMSVSNATKLSLSGANMTGGTRAYYSAATDKITIASHGFTLGLPVLYSRPSGDIGGLTTGTTYYIIPIDANTVELATTSARAILGLNINLTTQNAQLTAHTFTLAPLAITGTPGFKWQVSNDGTDYYDLNVSSITMGSYTAPYSTYMWDFSDMNYRYLRMNVTGPTTGGILLKAIMNLKSVGEVK